LPTFSSQFRSVPSHMFVAIGVHWHCVLISQFKFQLASFVCRPRFCGFGQVGRQSGVGGKCGKMGKSGKVVKWEVAAPLSGRWFLATFIFRGRSAKSQHKR